MVLGMDWIMQYKVALHTDTQKVGVELWSLKTLHASTDQASIVTATLQLLNLSHIMMHIWNWYMLIKRLIASHKATIVRWFDKWSGAYECVGAKNKAHT